HADFRDEVAERAARDDDGLERAELQAFDRFTLAAERARRELLEDELAVAQLLGRLGPGRGTGAVMRVDRQRVGELDLGLRLRGAHEGEGGDDPGGEGRKPGGERHGNLLGNCRWRWSMATPGRPRACPTTGCGGNYDTRGSAPADPGSAPAATGT